MKALPNKPEIESWLKNSWSRVLVFLQKIRENKKVNEAVSQVQQKVGPEWQKIRDDARVKEAVSKIQPYRRKIIAGGVAVIFVWLMLPSGSAGKRATIQYWASINKIAERESASVTDKPLVGDEHQSNAMVKAQELCDMMKRIRNGILDLPMANVDEELLNYAHNVVEASQKLEIVTTKLSNFVSEVKIEDENLGSFDNLAKHFFRGFSGDFTTSFKEMENLKGERKTRWLLLSSELTSAMEGIQKIQSDQMPLRALLTKRYGVEFK
ncbi:hypothetical protein [Prosthecobacter sp.]|uniref:hypothetical protein n=1 Tax=Prosthecobacter sp. TaxID=1965333 RepID=UPI0037837FD5